MVVILIGIICALEGLRSELNFILDKIYTDSMKSSTSMPKLPDIVKKSLTCKIASTEAWQKGEESVSNGSRIIYHTILKALKDGNGCLIGRHGTVELSLLLQAWQDPTLLTLDQCVVLERNAGVFPRTIESISKWVVEYWNTSESADILAVAWHKPFAAAEWKFLDDTNPSCQRIPLRSLEPYYSKPIDRWTRALEGQSVCVVSSFAETMEQQVTIASSIWHDDYETLLPNQTWSFVRSYYSPVLAQGRCEWPSDIHSWTDAVSYLEQEVLKTGARIVLLGCGGLAMPLAYRLKKKGRIAIVMGGAIQVLFGMKGKRWATHDVISRFWNVAWKYPKLSEIPGAADEIEGGCYW